MEFVGRMISVGIGYTFKTFATHRREMFFLWVYMNGRLSVPSRPVQCISRARPSVGPPRSLSPSLYFLLLAGSSAFLSPFLSFIALRAQVSRKSYDYPGPQQSRKISARSSAKTS